MSIVFKRFLLKLLKHSELNTALHNLSNDRLLEN